MTRTTHAGTWVGGDDGLGDEVAEFGVAKTQPFLPKPFLKNNSLSSHQSYCQNHLYYTPSKRSMIHLQSAFTIFALPHHLTIAGRW